MVLSVGKIYVLVINAGGKVLTFTAKIIKIDSYFVTFIDKFQQEISYNIKSIISYREVTNE
jgi:hypothetical protein